MKQKRLKILSFIYIIAALCSLGITVWDIILGGLFASSVDITGGLGVAAVCTLCGLGLSLLLFLVGLQVGRKFSARTLRLMLGLAALSLFTLIFCLVGQYLLALIPVALGILLPAATLLAIR